MKKNVQEINDGFSKTIKDLTVICGDNPETRMYLGSVDLDDIYIDKDYQGYRVHTKTDSLAANWNIADYNPIKVVPRWDMRKFSVYEGQNRVLAARKKGFKKIVAVFAMDIKEDAPKKDVKSFEASHFVNQNKYTENLRAAQKHGAYLMINDPIANIIQEMAKKYGFKVLPDPSTPSARQKLAGVLGSYGDTYGKIKSFEVRSGNGKDAADFIFSIIKNVGWMTENNGMSRAAIRSLAKIYEAYSDNSKEVHDCILTWFKKRNGKKPTSLSAIMQLANRKYPDRNDDSALIMYLNNIITDNTYIEKKIYATPNGRGVYIETKKK